MSRYQVILADDHTMFREGLKRIVGERDDIEVIGEAGDGLELLHLLKRKVPHMVILDISMPKLKGIEAAREIKRLFPEVKVLILTMYKDKQHLSHAFSAGADGYLLKENADRDLFGAIDTIRSGGIYVSPILSRELAEEWAHVCHSTLGSSLNPLTAREKEILKLVAEGRSNREIADLLSISVRTVESHRASVMEKLKLKNIADLVRYAIEKGYV